MDIRALLVAGLFLFGGAVYALHTDKMRVITVCHDSRLYMDGGIDAEIEGGGLNYHHNVKIFRRSNNKDLPLASFLVTAETPLKSEVQTYVAYNTLTLSIFKQKPQNDHGYQSHVEAFIQGDKISVNLNCLPKSI